MRIALGRGNGFSNAWALFVEIASPTEIELMRDHAFFLVFCVVEAILFASLFLVGAVRGGPLFYAVRCDDMESLRAGISKACRLTDRTLFGETLLHLATRQGRVEIAKFLVEAGLSPDSADRFGRTPRSIAENVRDSQMISLFKE